jgi:asparagine synthase (glutamine-hydrolysing)
MCGIAGFWKAPSSSADELTAIVRTMADTLRHRGPDDSGEWVDPVTGVALGFRRLAILDLSPSGHQPMASLNEQFVIVFNGEIYNYRDLKIELEGYGHRFRGTSDTEVILTACQEWGVVETLRRISGMFGLAVWDKAARTLTLARDRVGKKPVYFGRVNDVWIFGSELKALRAFPGCRPPIDREALDAFLRFSYLPAPASIYKGISKLLPGHYVIMRADGTSDVRVYWDAAEVVRTGAESRLELSPAEAIDEFETRLRDAVVRRMVADVPLGAFLSGGLDSSVVVALMQTLSPAPVRTFTIGFDVPGYNEAESAKSVAVHLGTNHTELYVTPHDALDVIPMLPTMFDEPFADSSQIPTFLVARLASQYVTVALSGDGGDELFGGYNRYAWAPGIWNFLRNVPIPIRQALATAIAAVPASSLDGIYSVVEPFVPQRWRARLPGDKAHKMASLLTATSEDDVYARLVSAWKNPTSVGPSATSWTPPGGFVSGDFRERMMYRDLVTYLPDDILVKVDRATMAVGLEGRAPLLDYRLIEWAWRLPMSLRIRNGVGKWLLRQVLYRHVPQALVDRPKMGFGIPIGEWLRGPLRHWAEDLLSVSALEDGEFLSSGPIRKVWQRHLTGHYDEQARLWPVLMFQAWRRQWDRRL